MNLATLEITPEEAAERLRDYQRMVADERTAEDAAIAAGYRAAARGLPVISLPDVIDRGGRFPNGLPRLAIARANAATCRVRFGWERDGRQTLIYYDTEVDRGRAAVGRNRVEVTVPVPEPATGRPIVPPQHRPRLRRMWRYHVLWEVESWTSEPPRDPALLRHIRGDLWAVLAVWDLTDLERAVLAARSTP